MTPHRSLPRPGCPSIEGMDCSPYLSQPARTEAEYKAQLRARALEKARAAVDRCFTDLRAALMDADTDKAAKEAIQSAIDGLTDYGMEIHSEIEMRNRDERIERLEAQDARDEAEYERSVRSLVGRV